jgi:uncharacterized protein (TIGR02246 family)
MTTQRAAIFKPLGLELTRQMEALMGRTGEDVGSVDLPPRPPMKIRLLTMKIRLLLTLVGLAFGFAVPALASFFQGDLAGDVKALDEFTALRMKEDEAFNKNDAAALAALFTEDAVYVVPEGLFSGRQAIEKRYADVFQRWHPTNFIGQADQLNAIGNEAWAVGEWWSTLQSQTGPKFARGYWSAIYVREGDGWKIRMLTVSEHPRPVSPAETK